MASEETGSTDGRRIPWDRVGLGIVGIFFGTYLYPPVLNGFGLLFDSVFGVFDSFLPFYAVIGVLAAVTGMYSGGIHTLIPSGGIDTTNKERMERLHKERLEAEAEGDEERLKEVYDKQGEVMGEEFESLKQQFKPFIWVLVGSMPVFIWVYWKVSSGLIDTGEETVILPLIGATKWSSNILLLDTWLVWYLLCSLVSNQVTRRVVRKRTTD